jgi:predicted nucleic acid-binding protein
LAQSPIVVADAGPLIHIDELGALDLLAGFSLILVPEAVWIEVTSHRPNVLNDPRLVLERVTPPEAKPDLQTIGKLYTLHQGEFEALAICSHSPGSRLLTDDTAARLAASALGIEASGTIGIVLRALRQRQRDKNQVVALLEAIPGSTSLHIRPSLLAEIIEEVKVL